MARMPAAEWVGEQSPRTPMTRYDIYCVHTIVGYAPAHAAHFSTKADGRILQSRDTAYRSAANLNGNHRIIACENEDHGPAFGGTPRLPAWVPLTDAQVVANGRILAWSHAEHGVPLKLCPNSRPTSKGLAYHRQGIDGDFGGYRFGGRVTGGEVWTLTPGKVCPTDVRIAQLPDILDAAVTLDRGGSIPTLEDDVQLSDIINPNADKADQLSVAEALRIAARSSARSEDTIRAILRSLSGLADEVAAAVAVDVTNDLKAGGGIDAGELRRIVYAQAQRAIDTRLGSLDEAK